MKTDVDLYLEAKFARMGARLKRVEPPRGRSTPVGAIRLDIRSDRDGEYFEVVRRPDAAVEVLDVQKADRHLLLLARDGAEKQKFLCGHDERHWFVAAVPESAPVGTVRAAKEALKPREVHDVQARLGLRAPARERRKNAAYRRQGEWFFLPALGYRPDPAHILRDEPIVRGNGGKPHRLEFCVRSGGETVYVCSLHPNGLAAVDYNLLLKRQPESKSWGWRMMARDATVYARGRVRHADHATIVLHDWHRVLMNTENQAKAMRHVAFLD